MTNPCSEIQLSYPQVGTSANYVGTLTQVATPFTYYNYDSNHQVTSICHTTDNLTNILTDICTPDLRSLIEPTLRQYPPELFL